MILFVTPRFTALKTFRTMNRNNRTALRAAPTFGLFFEEFRNTDLLYRLKVIDHAHAVLCFVPCIELAKTCAGKDRTVKTKPAL